MLVNNENNFILSQLQGVTHFIIVSIDTNIHFILAEYIDEFIYFVPPVVSDGSTIIISRDFERLSVIYLKMRYFLLFIVDT